MGEQTRFNKIAIFGHFGRGNLGDEATLAAVLLNVRRRQPNAEICAFTMNPTDTESRHKIQAFPIRRLVPLGWPLESGSKDSLVDQGGRCDQVSIAVRLKQWLMATPVLGVILRGLRAAVCAIYSVAAELAFLLRSSKRLRGYDIFIVAGGGQLGDYFEGIWGYPFTIFKWSWMASLRGAKVVFLSVGAGPIASSLSKRFFRQSLSLSAYRSFRDEHSRRLIESLHLSFENRVVPDLVHGLKPANASPDLRHPIRVVGINPLPFHDPRYWAEDSSGRYQHYVRTLADFAIWLIEGGRKVVLFPTQVRADPPVIKDVAAIVMARLPSVHGDFLACPIVSTFDDLLTTIAQTDLVLTGRFHGIVSSLLMGRPVIGLSYDPKADELMADVGLREFVADIGEFDLPWLVSRFEKLQNSAKSIRKRIEAKTSAYRTTLRRQYDDLFGKPADSQLRGVEGVQACLEIITQ